MIISQVDMWNAITSIHAPCAAFVRRMASALVLVLAVAACSDGGPLEPDGPDYPDIEALYAASVKDAALVQLLDAAGGWEGFRFPTAESPLSEYPQDPNNPLSAEKIALGRFLYHETALGIDTVRAEGLETYSCSSCHFAQAGFQAGLPQGIAEGGVGFGLRGEGRTRLSQYDSNPDEPDVQPIRTPSTLNTAYQELMLWNGELGGVGMNIGTEARWIPGTGTGANRMGFHGLETQAFAGLNNHRMNLVEETRIPQIAEYRTLFAAAFPSEPDSINRLNTALAIAAFERILVASEAPFQRWLRGEQDAMTEAEKDGALLFFGQADCVACHTGPALNSLSFHALGMGDMDASADPSRVHLDRVGGAVPLNVSLGRGGFTGKPEDQFKFKTPQLYNLDDSPFYGHGGSFATIRDVVAYKNAGVPENVLVPTSQIAAEFVPLGLTSAEIDLIAGFLERALYDDDLLRYAPSALPSGNCFPVNDAQARLDLGCN